MIEKDFEIAKNICEMCGAKAVNAQQDRHGRLRYACLYHPVQLWEKMQQEQ